MEDCHSFQMKYMSLNEMVDAQIRFAGYTKKLFDYPFFRRNKGCIKVNYNFAALTIFVDNIPNELESEIEDELTNAICGY
jgi:hypothetical protein